MRRNHSHVLSIYQLVCTPSHCFEHALALDRWTWQLVIVVEVVGKSCERSCESFPMVYLDLHGKLSFYKNWEQLTGWATKRSGEMGDVCWNRIQLSTWFHMTNLLYWIPGWTSKGSGEIGGRRIPMGLFHRYVWNSPFTFPIATNVYAD